LRRIATILTFVLCLPVLLLVGAVIWAALADWKLPRANGRNVRQWYEEALRLESETRPPALRAQMHEAFQIMGASAVPFLLDQLEATETDPGGGQWRRWRGPRSLRDDPRVPRWIRKLLPMPLDPSPNTFADLFADIGTDGLKAPKMETRLAALLSKWPEWQRGSVLQIYRSLRTGASNSAPLVATYFASTNEWNQMLSLAAFDAITPPGSPALLLLHHAALNRSVQSSAAIRILKSHEARFDDLLPILGEELIRDRGRQQEAALATIDWLRPGNGYENLRLAQALKDKEPRFRALVLKTIRHCGTNAASLAPDVQRCLNDEFYFVRAEAAKTLSNLGVASPAIIESLARSETDQNADVSEAAREARAHLRDFK
jgi:hypothetical protein